jgi:hypothetical protein
VESANDTARKILSDNTQVLHDMANALLERETIVEEDIRNIIEAAKSGSGEKKEKQPVAEQQDKDEPPAAESAEAGSSE